MIQRILCVDDDQDILDTLRIILESENYTVHCSASPAAIFETICDFAPDLILMDINMPEFNGLEVCRSLKMNRGTKNTPVIMVSSDDSIQSAISVFGANDVIRKPFEISYLIEKVKQHLPSYPLDLLTSEIDTETEDSI